LFIDNLQDYYRLHILHCEIIKTDSREINSSLSETRYSFQFKPDGLNAVKNYKGPLYTTEESEQDMFAPIQIRQDWNRQISNTKRTLSLINKTNTRRLQITNIINNHSFVWAWFLLVCMYWQEQFIHFVLLTCQLLLCMFCPLGMSRITRILYKSI